MPVERKPTKKAAPKAPTKGSPGVQSKESKELGKAMDSGSAEKRTEPVVKTLPREDKPKPTSQSPRYAGPVATGERDLGPEPRPLEVDVLKSDPRRNIPGGTSPYLDEVQREEAEKHRARVEGREPNLKNPPLIQGTPLRAKEENEL